MYNTRYIDLNNVYWVSCLFFLVYISTTGTSMLYILIKTNVSDRFFVIYWRFISAVHIMHIRGRSLVFSVTSLKITWLKLWKNMRCKSWTWSTETGQSSFKITLGHNIYLILLVPLKLDFLSTIIIIRHCID